MGGSTVVGGHIWDPSLVQFAKWDRFRVAVPGQKYPASSWRGDVLIGAGTPNHVRAAFIRRSQRTRAATTRAMSHLGNNFRCPANTMYCSIVRRFLLVALTGCGRIAFDPTGNSSDAVLPTGLIAWYQLDDTGTSYVDSIGGRDGACKGGCPTPTPGHHGTAQLFDGSTSCISIADDGQLQLATLTLALWTRQDAPVRQSALSKLFGTGSDDSWQIENTSTSLRCVRFTSRHSGLADTVSPDNVVILNRWHHLAATWDGATKRLFLDGVEQRNVPVATPIMYDNGPLLVGCDNNAAVDVTHYLGALDDVQIYNRALDSGEVLDLALR